MFLRDNPTHDDQGFIVCEYVRQVMVNETRTHRLMKEYVAEQLQEAGFKTELEAGIGDVGGDWYSRADVLAERNGYRVVFEVGQSNPDALERLEAHVDEVIHVSAGSSHTSIAVDQAVNRVFSDYAGYGNKKATANQVLIDFLEREGTTDELQRHGFDSWDELRAVAKNQVLDQRTKEDLDDRIADVV